MAITMPLHLRHRWVLVGGFFDRWYEELPWRRRLPLGRRGEQIAARHLRRCGYRILARNFRAAGAEIDLVATDRGSLVFIEVKTRSSAAFGAPAEAVDQRKAARIRRAAAVYLRRAHAGSCPLRFDLVAIVGVGRAGRLELTRDAF